MRRATVIAIVVLAAALVPAPSSAAFSVEDVTFSVTNPLDPKTGYSVAGRLFRPDESCAGSVMLLLHGLSYGKWAWDFSEDLSVARALAARGYASVAIDEPGYGGSTHPNGYTLTVQSYAEMTAEIVGQLRAGSYAGGDGTAFGHVGLMGHSAGTEISTLAAGLFGGVDVLIATAYTHFPSQTIVEEFVTGDMVRALGGDYEYFGGTPDRRLDYMYNRDVADPDVMAADTAMAVDTPSGEILSISNQPSRWVQGAITVPVLLLLAQNDLLFPVEFGDEELALFAGATDRTLAVVPTAGHSFMLHPNASISHDVVGDWLEARASAMPAC